MRLSESPARLGMMVGAVTLVLGMQVNAETVGQNENGPKASTLGYSVDKMDPGADPKQDFYRFAAGRWVDELVIPADSLTLSSSDMLLKQNSTKLEDIIEQATASSAKALKGSSIQQVGDFFASGMDLERLKTLGVKPLQPMLDKIDAIDSPTTLAQALAEFSLTMSDSGLFMAGVIPDEEDPTVYSVAVVVGSLGMDSQEDYLNDDKEALRNAYLVYVADSLKLMGISTKAASSDARLVLEIERRIAAQKLTPVENMVPKNRFTRMSMSELGSLLPNLDVSAYMRTLGLPTDGEVIVMERKALTELNKMLKEYRLSDIKTYLRWTVLRNTKGMLTPDFDASSLAFLQARYGDIEMPSRAKQMTTAISALLGHPLSQLYVEEYFADDTLQRVTDMVGRIKAMFRARLANNKWLSDATRIAALEKIDRLTIDVGYPQQWIDYSGIDVRRDDLFGNTQRLNETMARRDLAKLGKPVMEDDFSVPGVTLPIDINAGYDQGRNKIEIPAAFLQPPFFDPDLDEAANYCTVGAVIGHEITHGFDSSGRLYDATGNLRDWWTSEDSAWFITQTDKLVKQANAYEVLPGLQMNGELTVTENLADVGGLSLAYAGLLSYLQEHPEANRKKEGYTPEQRCFLAWAQAWSGKSREGYLRQITAVDSHASGPYRSVAAPVHLDGFFTAFDIKRGDAMWRAEEDRVKIW